MLWHIYLIVLSLSFSWKSRDSQWVAREIQCSNKYGTDICSFLLALGTGQHMHETHTSLSTLSGKQCINGHQLLWFVDLTETFVNTGTIDWQTVMQVLCNKLPKEEKKSEIQFYILNAIADQSNLICFDRVGNRTKTWRLFYIHLATRPKTCWFGLSLPHARFNTVLVQGTEMVLFPRFSLEMVPKLKPRPAFFSLEAKVLFEDCFE